MAKAGVQPRDESGPGGRQFRVAAQDSDLWDYTEIQLLYATRSAADEDIAHRYYMAMVVPVVVYGGYQQFAAAHSDAHAGADRGANQRGPRRRTP